MFCGGCSSSKATVAYKVQVSWLSIRNLERIAKAVKKPKITRSLVVAAAILCGGCCTFSFLFYFQTSILCFYAE